MSISRSTPGGIVLNWKETQNHVKGAGYSERVGSSFAAWLDTFDGVQEPKWKQIISNGGDATTPMSGVKHEVFGGDGVIHAVHSGPMGPEDFTIAGNWYSFYGWSSLTGDTTSANNQALMSIYRQLRGKTTLFDGLVALGEFRETLHMLINPLGTLRSVLRKYTSNLVKRSKGKAINDIKKVVTDTYLEFIFGWTPAASDLMKVLSILQGYTVRRANVRLSGYGQSSVSSEFSAQNLANNYCYYIADSNLRTDVTVQYKVGYRPLEFSTAPTFAQLYGFTPERFAATVWELLPYSWISDYFANIGNLIDAYSSLRYTPCYVARTTRTTQRRSVVCRADPQRGKAIAGSNFISLEGMIGPCDTVLTTVSRQKLASLPYPELHFDFNVVPKQLLNIAAVLAQTVDLQRQFSKRAGPRPSRLLRPLARVARFS